MTQIKILAKISDRYHQEYFGAFFATFTKLISQETVMEQGQEVPKYEIFILAPDHPKWKEIKETKIELDGFGHFKKGYDYEISFVDSDDLLKKHDGTKDERKRVFGAKNNIEIIDKSYSNKLAELKLQKQSNLMPEEKWQWEQFIGGFRQELARVSDKNSVKYKDGRKFIEDLETELNNKDKPNDRERERESKFDRFKANPTVFSC